MARRHHSYVNVYGGGARGSVIQTARLRDKRIQKYKGENPDMTECPRCGRFYKDPTSKHYADFKNKIRCMEPLR